ncbi:hypothetical protein HLB23_28460 [Nocardia uniformis]|uniref:Uncharacterized protein n=1 Tax=Nocardia uniformis TaxID=53432 RepID=A0A849CII5_9NOCA|nr:hypothetical protein [Nocardia uniformis]NNH73741.1 hypothetical protein [Nocardia uniformis]
MTTITPSSLPGGSRRGAVPRTVRPVLLATFSKAELVEDVPDIDPHIHASQGS